MIRRFAMVGLVTVLSGACAGDNGAEDGGGGAGGGAPSDGPAGEAGQVKCGPGGACTLPHAMSTCLQGVCQVTACNAGFGDCNTTSGDGCEADLGADPANCSVCGMACPTRMNAAATCKDGTCGFVCATGFGNCDDAADTGCEADLRIDPNNCGSCTAKCGTKPNSVATCAMSMCGIKCAAGYASCDGDTGNGCETFTETDPKNCGKCGMTCGPADACLGGMCKPAPKVLFYREKVEQPFLPEGAVAEVVDTTKWKTLTMADFAAYTLIVIGDDPIAPLKADYDAAYDTRATWAAAVTGRVVVHTLDPTYHATSTVAATKAGATAFAKAALAWAMGGKGTGLYVSSDWALRAFDFLSPFGAWDEATGSPDKIHITMPSHPLMAGSTDETLSTWGTSGHGVMTAFPSSFVSLALETGGMPGRHIVVVRE